ncbi:hypothetical protein NQ315_003533, partial [Exocentrus adspersus]
VALIFGVAGACRGKELHQLTISDVTDMDHALLVNVRNTKNNVDQNLRRRTQDFLFGMRKVNVLFKPLEKTLLEKYHNAEYLNLPNSTLYTGHCFRRTSASLLADSGASIDVWKRHGGWKSASVAEGYIENSINTKKIVADSIFGLGVGNSTESASATKYHRRSQSPVKYS